MSKHFEGLGRAWLTVFDNLEQRLPAAVAHTLSEGGSRDCWQCKTEKAETMVIAWPEQSGFRLAVTVKGKPGEELKPVSSYPLLEGLPNDMTIEEVYPWKNRTEGEVSAFRNEGASPLWMYTPFLFRDQEGLTPGVRQTFLVAGLAYGVRKALLDEMTITEGPDYERYAADWMEKHPGSERLDVPQLSVNLRGARILVPGEFACEYQLRGPVSSVDELEIGGEKVYVLIMEFGLNTPNPLRFPLYAPARICKDVPQTGMDIDALIWLQGRMLD